MRIKKTLQPFVDGELIKFGFGNSSLERSLPFSANMVSLIRKLDSSIVYKVDLSYEEQELVEKMLNMGLLTSNEYGDSKYSRNYNFYEWIDTSSNLDPSIYQEKLAKSHVLIVGAGGIGSTISEILVRLGIGHLTIVDFDIVESSNLTRQSSFTKMDIGSQKLNVLKKYLESIGDAHIDTIEKKITSFQDLEECYLHDSFNVVVCCADTPRIQIDYWFDELTEKYKIPLLIGSYASTVVNYLAIQPGKTISLKDFYDRYAVTDDQLLDNDYITSVIAPISYLAASMISFKIFDVLTGLVDLPFYMQLDCLDWKVVTLDESEVDETDA